MLSLLTIGCSQITILLFMLFLGDEIYAHVEDADDKDHADDINNTMVFNTFVFFQVCHIFYYQVMNFVM